MPRSDRTSTDDALKQLKTVLNTLKQANGVLDGVASTWAVPDGPEQPPFIDVLNSINAQGQHAIEVSKRLLSTMGQ